MTFDEKELDKTIAEAIELKLAPLQVRISTLEKAVDLWGKTLVEAIIDVQSIIEKQREGSVN